MLHFKIINLNLPQVLQISFVTIGLEFQDPRNRLFCGVISSEHQKLKLGASALVSTEKRKITWFRPFSFFFLLPRTFVNAHL